MNGCSPEIVEEDVFDRHMRPEISVVLDGTDVVEHEAALEAVVVTGEAGNGHQPAQEVATTSHAT